jgi:hypothetical protein
MPRTTRRRTLPVIVGCLALLLGAHSGAQAVDIQCDFSMSGYRGLPQSVVLKWAFQAGAGKLLDVQSGRPWFLAPDPATSAYFHIAGQHPSGDAYNIGIFRSTEQVGQGVWQSRAILSWRGTKQVPGVCSYTGPAEWEFLVS